MTRAPGSGFKFTLKELLVFIASTALALGSFKADDPWIAIPMLAISGCAFVGLCIWHKGKALVRAGAGFVLVALLTFTGWRDLQHGVQTAPPSQSSVAPVQPQPIVQSATDSPCANNVAQSGSKIDCNAGKGQHDKDRVKH